MTNKIDEIIKGLSRQVQLDEDGVMVSVSREAVELAKTELLKAKKYREALEFYAERKNYIAERYYTSPINIDMGLKAKVTLSEVVDDK